MSRLSIGFIGYWHTHPVSQPLPSKKDLLGMHEILTTGPLPPRKQVMMIIGKMRGRVTAGIYLFRRLSGNNTTAVYEALEARLDIEEIIL